MKASRAARLTIFFCLILVGCGRSDKELEEWGAEFEDCKSSCRANSPSADLIYCADTCMDRKGL